MKVPDVVGYLKEDARAILEEKGIRTTFVYYDEFTPNLYEKSNVYRVVRQKSYKDYIELLLMPQCK